MDFDIEKYKRTLNEELTLRGPEQALDELIKRVDNRLDLSKNLHTLQANYLVNEKLFHTGQGKDETYRQELSKIDAALRDIIGALHLSDLVDEMTEFNPAESEKEQPNSAFISTPIASFTAEEYRQMKLIIKKLIRVLRFELGILHIYYAGEDIEGIEDFHSPEIAIKQDMQGICSYEYFIMIYPGRYLSSVLVEAGYALALRKKCLFFVNKRDDLPFILRSADKVFKRVRIVEFGTMEEIPDLLKTMELNK